MDLVDRISRIPALLELTQQPRLVAAWLAQHAGPNSRTLKETGEGLSDSEAEPASGLAPPLASAFASAPRPPPPPAPQSQFYAPARVDPRLPAVSQGFPPAPSIGHPYQNPYYGGSSSSGAFGYSPGQAPVAPSPHAFPGSLPPISRGFPDPFPCPPAQAQTLPPMRAVASAPSLTHSNYVTPEQRRPSLRYPPTTEPPSSN